MKTFENPLDNEELFVQIQEELSMDRKVREVLEKAGLYEEYMRMNMKYNYSFGW